MEPEELDEQEVLETPVEEESEEEASLTAEEVAELREKAAKVDELEEKNKKLFERAKKAETKPTQKEGELSNKDILYLAKAEIHEDDMDEVLDWAKFKKISVKEAHESLKGTLEQRNEQRKTALASQTNAGQRGGNKTTPSQILESAKAGRFPEDDAGIAALVAAEIAQKTGKN